jgi:predicted enzyme related to lactoylglutathione lyase
MGKRERYEPGTFCWVDLATTDAAGAKDFYSGLFGWDAEDMPAGEDTIYTMLSLDGDYVGGLYQIGPDQREGGTRPSWLSYVSVESADAVVERASELGGTVYGEAFDVLDSGRMAIIADPEGATLAAWEPRSHPGAGRVNDVGCLTWNELQTRDPETASSFYSGLFGWETQPIEEDGRHVYTTIKNAGSSNGGFMPMTEGHGDTPPHWLPYFTVASCDGGAARVRELGGAVIAGPVNLGAGRIAVVSDPQGTAFAVFEGETDD